MINSELLKEAIADAKAVRATALANAKASLEEAFAPRFEAMFADKLREESEEEEEEGLTEVEAPNQVDAAGGEAKAPATKAVTKGNPKTPKGGAGDTSFKAVQAGKGPTDVPKLGKKVNETAEEEEEEGKKMDETYEEEEEGKKIEEAGLTSEDLDEIIKELESEVAGEEEGKVEEPVEEPVASPEGGEGQELPPTDGAEGGEELPVEAPPVAGGEEDDAVTAQPGSEVNIDLGPEAGAPEDGAVPPPAMNAGGVEEPVVQPHPQSDDEENINLEELLAALNEEAEEEEEGKEEMDETLNNNGIPTNELAGQNKTGGTNVYPKGPDASKKQLPGKNHNIGGKGNIGDGGVGGKPVAESAQYKVALKEAYKTIEFLRGQINEVNLLNAKLLYTNKLFKEFAGVLDDTYRMKIVESFDLTKSVREVKLAYALLAESLNFGKQMTKNQSAKPIVKSTPQKGQVKQITEGFASKPVSSTKPSQLITEGNEMALRFKKLAGIKDTPKIITEKK
jgi:hypothetical protein